VTPLIAEPHGSEADVNDAVAAALPGRTDVPALVGKLWQALDDERLRAVSDRGEVERLRALTGNQGLYVEVPAFDEDVHDLRALARVGTYLTRSA